MQKTLDIPRGVCYNKYMVKGVSKMKDHKEKPTAFEIVKLIIEAVVAVAALITAIKWW